MDGGLAAKVSVADAKDDRIDDSKYWYVLRDLTRNNAKCPAYKALAEKCIEVFTPMKSILVTLHGRKIREEIPIIHDLLFVHERRSILDPIVLKIPTLQYRFVRGHYLKPMIVRDADMERFMRAIRTCDAPRFYSPGELTPQMYGKHVQLIGGPLDGYEGRLLSVKGLRKKRILIELPDLVSVSVEVNPDYIRLME